MNLHKLQLFKCNFYCFFLVFWCHQVIFYIMSLYHAFWSPRNCARLQSSICPHHPNHCYSANDYFNLGVALPCKGIRVRKVIESDWCVPT